MQHCKTNATNYIFIIVIIIIYDVQYCTLKLVIVTEGILSILKIKFLSLIFLL